MRLCMVTERISPPLDEGFKIGISRLTSELEELTSTLMIGRDHDPATGPARTLNRLFLSAEMATGIRSFRPQATLYLPHSSLTIASLGRARVLRWMTGKPVAVVGFQPRHYGGKWPLALRRLKPDLALVQSRKSAEVLMGLGISASVFNSGVDLERFRPVSRDAREKLRAKLNLPPKGRLLVHVGHLTSGRGLEELTTMAAPGDSVVVVTSSSTEANPAVRRTLERCGCHVVTGYQPQIERFYQVADVYVFPTSTANAAIEFPLSVLEALACGAAVLTRPFGGLAEALPEAGHLKYYQSEEEGAAALADLQSPGPEAVDALREELESRFTWKAVAAGMLASLEGLA